jgi:ATP-binding cassette subfamily E protein 1
LTPYVERLRKTSKSSWRTTTSLSSTIFQTLFPVLREPSVYGVVAGPYGVREGINIFIEGYIPDENMRFRDEKIDFQVRPPPREENPSGEVLRWPEMTKSFESFRLRVSAGWVGRGEVLGIVGPNGIGKTTFASITAGRLQTDEGYSFDPKAVSYKPPVPHRRRSDGGGRP